MGHQVRYKQNPSNDEPYEPFFCYQVTELYPCDVMVCCSTCSTWRHAFCGGHYRYTGHSITDSTSTFLPLCDRCHEEEPILNQNPQSKALIERQRNQLVRRALATSHVMRHASFAKHGGTYKWPLGSVSATHIGGHTRSVHARHERSEKQWSEMAMKLGNGLGYRPKERVKVRVRELERLLVNINDSELYTDRQNMLLFLQRDTAKQCPAGYETPRRNFFDPEDDYLLQLFPLKQKDDAPNCQIPENEIENDSHHTTESSQSSLDSSLEETNIFPNSLEEMSMFEK